MNQFPGRVALQQRVCPAYRAPFFDALAQACEGGLSVFAGEPLAREQIPVAESMQFARFFKARNRHFLDPSSSLYQCWQEGLLEWLQDWQPDTLIVEANPRHLSTGKGIEWMHSLGRPVIGWGLGAPPLSGILGRIRQWRRNSFLNTLDGVIAYSQRGAEEYRRMGIPSECIFVATNAVSPRPTSHPHERGPLIDGKPLVLFVGRLQRRKRIDHLLQACASMPEEVQPRLKIVGEGPARKEFQELAESIYPGAEFSGALYGDELEACFTAADLFVLPGSGGLAVQQAMAHGLPVIVAQGDGTQDDLVRPENGWSVPPDDLGALGAALLEALANPEKLREMGKASFQIVDREINLEAMVGTFVRALQQIVVN